MPRAKNHCKSGDLAPSSSGLDNLQTEQSTEENPSHDSQCSKIGTSRLTLVRNIQQTTVRRRSLIRAVQQRFEQSGIQIRDGGSQFEMLSSASCCDHSQYRAQRRISSFGSRFKSNTRHLFDGSIPTTLPDYLITAHPVVTKIANTTVSSFLRQWNSDADLRRHATQVAPNT
jgi:hypothetical protein